MAIELFFKISDFAYFKSNKPIDIDMSDNVEEIGTYAYAETSNVKIRKLSNNLKIIKAFAFNNSNIDQVKFPSSLKIIEAKAFSGCKNLKSIVIPEGVESIGSAAFANCKNLEEVYLPNSLKKLPAQMFLNCHKLKKVHLPDGTTYLPDEFFKGCYDLDINLDQITEIGNGVFNNCKSLSKIPAHIKSFKAYDFKGCKSLREAHIDASITTLPDHLFDGCFNLRKVTIDGKVSIGYKTFRNCVSLTDIPENIKEYGKYAFENCRGLTSVTLNSKYIPEGLFRGCVNLSEIKDFKNVSVIESYGLDNTGFESINLSNIKKISKNILSNSKKLKSVNLGHHHSVGDYAFYRCPKLMINLKPTITSVGKMAFAYNKQTKELVLSPFLEDIQDGAFAFSNFETIICNGNPTFTAFNNKLLINTKREDVMQYACGAKDKKFSIADYSEQEFEDSTIIYPLGNIRKYAFAGAKHLEELEIPSCISDLEITAFEKSPKLKTLAVRSIDIYPMVHFVTKNNGILFLNIDLEDPESKIKEVDYPFEVVKFLGDEIQISSNSFNIFSKLKEVKFPENGHITIANNVFDNTSIRYALIPKNVTEMRPRAFNKGCTLKFKDSIERKDIFCVDSDKSLRYDYRVFTLEDDSYLVEGNDHIVSFSEDTMKKYVKQNDYIYKKPSKFIDYIYNLQELGLEQEKCLFNGILMDINVKVRERLLDYYKANPKETKLVLKKSGLLTDRDKYSDKLLSEDGIIDLLQFIDLVKKYHITESELLNRILIAENPLDSLEAVLCCHKDLLINIIKTSGIFKETNQDNQQKDPNMVTDNGNLIKFLNFMVKYDLKDPFLFNPCIINLTNHPELAEKLFKNYNNNMKRLIKSANVLNTQSLENSTQNLIDLLTLIYITGGFESDPIIKQRALTFITEKITLDFDNGKKNERTVTGDNFHRLFNFGDNLRSEFDLEFANFFLENYNDLYDREIKRSGFIGRAYANFRTISRTSTADKGIQRHKKVTMEKVINFLLINKFDNVSYEERELADFIGEWYDKNDVWLKVKEILAESKDSPRNIFTKITYDEEGKPIYDMEQAHDLKDEVRDNFSYEWLNKKAAENLVLGKYCNCCAHVNGAGAGIMRSSIILDNVQNLVIRNTLGEIVAKSTLYINREKGYGVFNNVEASLELKKSEDLESVYQAFMRGAKKFIEVYNENNDIKITELTIGADRNRIKEQFHAHKHEDHAVLEPLNYSTYGYDNGHYRGDAMNHQMLVLNYRSEHEKTNC